MKVAVITFPGSNCDTDLVEAIKLVGGEAELVWHRSTGLAGFDAVMLPGGFSYGDYLRPAAIARLSPIMRDVRDFARRGGPVLGVCNGFQLLCEAGLLPGALIRNASLRFRSSEARVRVERTDTPFTAGYGRGDVLSIPIAHAEGCYHADPEVLKRIKGDGLVAFRYVDRSGAATREANPNGSAANIAGLANGSGNVLGMMPHPERAVEAVLGSTDGRGTFESIVSLGEDANSRDNEALTSAEVPVGALGGPRPSTP